MSQNLFIFPLVAEAYLLQYPGTRPIRIALAGVGIAIIAHAALTFRIQEPEYNAINILMSVGYLHNLGKYVEFAAMKGTIIDPYRAKGRSRLMSAFDLCFNSRWIGLPPVFPEEVRDPSREERHRLAKSPATPGKSKAAFNGHAKVSNGHYSDRKGAGTDAIDQSRWLSLPTTRRTRLEAALRHLALFATHFCVVDTMLLLMRTIAGDSVGTAVVPKNVWTKYLNTPFTFFPGTPYAWRVPPWGIILASEFSVGAGIWQILSMGYHFFAFLAVGSGIWEVESWEMDIMYSPWKCDSLLDLWGRGWHQLFRHHFLILSIWLLRTLGLNPRGPLLLPLIFTWSAGLHMIAGLNMASQLSTNGDAHPLILLLPVGLFFFLSGVGCAIELGFRQTTGRRVRGWWGRIWMWTWLILSAIPGARAWMESGMCGNLLTGPGWVGRWIVPLIRQVLDVPGLP